MLGGVLLVLGNQLININIPKEGVLLLHIQLCHSLQITQIIVYLIIPHMIHTFID